MPTRELQRPRLEPTQSLPLQKAPTVLDRLIDTPASLMLTVCRWLLGGVMIAHASQKVFGWFGGPGWFGTIQGFREHMGIPAGIAVLVILAEFLGSIGLIVGFLSRLSAAAIIAVMAGAIALVHAKMGFFMNWYGKGPGEGFEYHLLAIGLGIAILYQGSGAMSIDRALAEHRKRTG